MKEEQKEWSEEKGFKLYVTDFYKASESISTLACTYLRWAEAAPGTCVFVASVMSSEPSRRGNTPTGCTWGQKTEERERRRSLNFIQIWNLYKQSNMVCVFLWYQYVHWLHPWPGVCVRLPCERVCAERCKHRGRHAALPPHTPSWASPASELESERQKHTHLSDQFHCDLIASLRLKKINVIRCDSSLKDLTLPL